SVPAQCKLGEVFEWEQDSLWNMPILSRISQPFGPMMSCGEPGQASKYLWKSANCLIQFVKSRVSILVVSMDARSQKIQGQHVFWSVDRLLGSILNQSMSLLRLKARP